MSKGRIEDIFVETLYKNALSEQNISNRLYKGEASKESYFVATVSAQVLRNVAQALEQAINIHRGFVGLDKQPPIANKSQSVYERMQAPAPDRAGVTDRAEDVDPDIFREWLERLVTALDDYPEDHAPLNLLSLCRDVLDKNPISPARQVQSKYEGYLEECRQLLGQIQHRVKNDIEIKNTSFAMVLVDHIEGLTKILNK